MAPMTGKVIKDWTVDLPSPTTNDADEHGWNLNGKTVLVVGGTSGLGQALALECQSLGANVTVIGRTFKEQEHHDVVDDANTSKTKKTQFVQADLSLMKEAKRIGKTIKPADVTIFTTGIMAAKTRQESAEGIELDMAVSFLSRLVILKYLVPRLQPNARVFIMGFPGANIKPVNLDDDWNTERSYSGGAGFVHMNTVVGNEALVLDYASKGKSSASNISFFGLNPGLIKTGIRSNVYENGGIMQYIGPIIEGMVGLFNPTPTSYAHNIVPLLFSTSLDDPERNGAMFNPKAQPVEASTTLTNDPELVTKIITTSEDLVKSKAGIAW